MRELSELDLRDGLAIQPEDVRGVELQLGVTLPPPYKLLVQMADGASPEVGIFTFGSEGESCVSEFLPVRHLLQYAQYASLPLVPIARDAGDNLVCLYYASAEPSVVYLDHETNALSPIAATFEAFIDQLRE